MPGDADRCFAVRSTASRGRAAFASCALVAGETILKEDAFAACLYPQHTATRCDFSFARPAKLLRCSRSKNFRFASADCQKRAWKQYYRWESKSSLASSSISPVAPTVRLAARILWRSLSEKGQGFAQVQGLQDHWDVLCTAAKERYLHIASLVVRYMAGTTTECHTSSGVPARSLDARDVVGNETAIARLVCALACNVHTIVDVEQRPLGIGVYPLGAMFNHSCTPNCVQVCCAVTYRKVASVVTR
jgi:SET and MYND domain-containing protein